MADKQKARGRGRLPKVGGALAMLDDLLREADPAVLEFSRSLFGNGTSNDLMGNPEQAAETLRRDRKTILNHARLVRASKPSEKQKEATRERAERLAKLEVECAKRPGKKPSDVARILQESGKFLYVARGTLNKDIAFIKKLARIS